MSAIFSSVDPDSLGFRELTKGYIENVYIGDSPTGKMHLYRAAAEMMARVLERHRNPGVDNEHTEARLALITKWHRLREDMRAVVDDMFGEKTLLEQLDENISVLITGPHKDTRVQAHIQHCYSVCFNARNSPYPSVKKNAIDLYNKRKPLFDQVMDFQCAPLADGKAVEVQLDNRERLRVQVQTMPIENIRNMVAEMKSQYFTSKTRPLDLGQFQSLLDTVPGFSDNHDCPPSDYFKSMGAEELQVTHEKLLPLAHFLGHFRDIPVLFDGQPASGMIDRIGYYAVSARKAREPIDENPAQFDLAFFRAALAPLLGLEAENISGMTDAELTQLFYSVSRLQVTDTSDMSQDDIAYQEKADSRAFPACPELTFLESELWRTVKACEQPSFSQDALDYPCLSKYIPTSWYEEANENEDPQDARAIKNLGEPPALVYPPESVADLHQAIQTWYAVLKRIEPIIFPSRFAQAGDE